MESRSINDEIRQIRHELAAQFDNDLEAILADIRKSEALDGRKYVTLAPRRISQKMDRPQDSSPLPFSSVTLE